MSKIPRKASPEAREEPESHSVYDFLFQDSRRIGSLLAQFDPSGHLLSVKQVESANESYTDSSEYKGAVNLAAVKGEASAKDEAMGGNSRSAERDYDPLWVNALALLSYLQQGGFMVRELPEARLGQIILITGKLSVFDMSFLQKLWADPATLRKIAGMVGDKSKVNAVEKHSGVLKILSMMPHPVQATLETNAGIGWTILNDESLEISASSLFLKYGTEVSGEWNMLGILDAMPDEVAIASEPGPPKDMNTLIDAMRGFQQLAKRLGRPPEAHGLTPLLIFRKLEQRA